MSKLADYGLSIETTAKKRWLKRGGVSVPITSLQRDMLDWLDGAVKPSLEYCCDELWEQVEPDWVRGQWDKLAAVMQPLGAAVMMDDSDMLFLALVDAEGGPIQPVLEDEPEAADTPALQHAEPTDDEVITSLRGEIATRDEMLKQEVALRIGAMQRLKDAEAERDELKRWTEQVRDNSALVNELEQARARIAELEAAQAQPSAEIVPLREYPVRIAPHYLTVPVSEVLFRWLEATGDRNRRSADDVARALLVAFMRSAGNREAA